MQVIGVVFAQRGEKENKIDEHCVDRPNGWLAGCLLAVLSTSPSRISPRRRRRHYFRLLHRTVTVRFVHARRRYN